MKQPRKHNPKWKDNTRNQRQQKRNQALNEQARAWGYPSWSAYETSVINGKNKYPAS